MMTKQTKFILAVALQAVIILSIIIFKMTVLAGGIEVLLQIRPVDPRDMLRGDYVTFQYDISTISSYLPGEREIRTGTTVYTLLQQSGKYWRAESIQTAKPLGGAIFIKGTVQNVRDSTIQVVYGVEEYFIPEGKGQGFSFANKEAAAKVMIDDDGHAVLKQLYVNDNPWP